ncbi:MAG: hypothetical protein ACR650_03590 [Methylocystis sp.]|jgi:hypothetical protein
MQTMAQLKAMHHQMMTDLSNLPQYRALKAIDRFITEMGQIYSDEPARPEKAADTLQHRLNAAIENRVANELSSNSQARVSSDIPDNRVA